MSEIQSQPIQQFLEREERNQKKNTYQNRKTGLRAFDEWLSIEGRDIDEIDFVAIEDFADWCTTSSISGNGVSDRSAYLYIQQVEAFYHRKRKEELAEENNGRINEDDIVTPVDHADLNLNLTETEREKHTREDDRKGLTPKEMEKMVEHAPGPNRTRNQLVMKLLGGTGCRPRDLRDMRVEDVDLENKRIKIRSSKTTNSRKVPISDGLKQYLNLWLNHGRRSSCFYAESTDYLIPGDYSEQIGKRTIESIVHDAAEEADLQDIVYTDGNGNDRGKITPYSFRYGYATVMKNKVEPTQLQYLMGHKKIETTLTYYPEVTEEDRERMQQQVPDI